MTKDELVALAKATAAKYGLDPAVVCGIVTQESTWEPYSIRFEPAFFSKYVSQAFANHKFGSTEAYARSFSWGLMQCMGEDAREFDYTGPLPQLCDPATGLDIGCKIFAHKFKVNNGSLHDALQAWNGGGAPNYADQVLAHAKTFQA